MFDTYWVRATDRAGMAHRSGPFAKRTTAEKALVAVLGAGHAVSGTIEEGGHG